MNSNNICSQTGLVGNNPHYVAPKTDEAGNEKTNSAALFFQIAVEPRPGLKDRETGEYVDQTPYWMPCAIFGARAIALNKAGVIKKGQTLSVASALHITEESLTLADGTNTKRSKPLLVVEDFQIVHDPSRFTRISSQPSQPVEA